MLISETKVGKSFPSSKFKNAGFSSSHRADRNKKRRGIVLLFREDLPVKILSVDNGNGELLCSGDTYAQEIAKKLLIQPH